MANRHDYTGSERPTSRLASRLCASERFLIVDVETTDLGPQAEPVEIAILNGSGVVVLEAFVRPDGEISGEALELHGLASEIRAEAPSFAQVSRRLWSILPRREVVAYVTELGVSDGAEMAAVAGAWARWADDPGAMVARFWLTAVAWAPG